jgi:hypothetical protein
MKKQIVLLVFCIFILAACAPKVTATEISSNPSAAPEQPTTTATQMPSLTPEPAATEQVTATVEATATPGVTQEPVKFTFVSASAQWQTSSMFVLDASSATGSYYATASADGSDASKYVCAFSQTNQYRLTCTGGAMPFKQHAYINLYDSSTNELVYSNTITFAGIVPTPTGMSCEVEPQWNGFIPAHQGDKNCFALTCYQNGSFFYGDNNTCDQPWPFEWDFIHPLSTPTN